MLKPCCQLLRSDAQAKADVGAHHGFLARWGVPNGREGVILDLRRTVGSAAFQYGLV
jgi:hypothetical protein